MLRKYALLVVLAGCILAALSGCDSLDLSKSKLKPKPKKDDDVPPEALPVHVAGTVMEFATLDGGGLTPIQGFGLMVGLGVNGAKEVPSHLKDYMIQYLAKKNIGSFNEGMGGLSPMTVLQDRDTATVMVVGAIPFGAPKGTRFDLIVGETSPIQSMDGGYLWETDMSAAWGGVAAPNRYLPILAHAQGSVFVNPFLDANNPAEQPQLRQGRILGGAKVKDPVPIRLVLRKEDYARARLITSRINEVFTAANPVAVAENRYMIAVTVPKEWRDDYQHFVQIIMHLPLRLSPGAKEYRARQIIEAMEAPGAQCDEMGLTLEAMGKEVVPPLKKLYVSRNPAAAFFAARTGARLDDDAASEVLVAFATNVNSPFRLMAIEELGRRLRLSGVMPVLQGLLEDEHSLVRVAAYEGLLKRGERTLVVRQAIGGRDKDSLDADNQFYLDLIKCQKVLPVINASQSLEARIVLFDKDMEVSRPIYFTMPNDSVTIRADANDAKLSVFRKIPRTGRLSDTLQCDCTVKSLITLLGSSPLSAEGEIQGLGLSYGQVVAVLYRMCKNGDIRATFDLQPPPEMPKIYSGVPSGPRLDAPAN